MKRIILLSTSLAVALALQAEPRTLEQMKQIAVQQLHRAHTATHHRAIASSSVMLMEEHDHLSLLGTADGACVIVTNDDRLPAVLGVIPAPSTTGARQSAPNPEFAFYLEAADAAMAQALNAPSAAASYRRVQPNTAVYPAEVPNLLKTTWSQDEPYKNHTPLMPNGDNYVTGCVATSMAQVLAYHRLPMRGNGEAQLTAPDGSVMKADFGHTLYDWDNMKASYNHVEKDYTFEEGEAVATLMAHCGVATNMAYGEGGSGTSNSEALNALKTYFGYQDARLAQRTSYSNDESWMNLIFDELAHRSPIMYGATSTYGHSFVFSGYNADGLVYVNWGWGGDHNGWFDVNVLDPDNNGGFVNNQSMVIGIRSYQPDVWTETVNTTAGGQLASLLNASLTYGEIKVVGPINSDDLRHLRERINSQKRNSYPNAADTYSLDLSEAQIVVGGQPFLTEGKNQYQVVADDCLPDRAFYGCTNLRYLRLPASLKAIGKGAFAGCQALTALEGEGDDFVCDGNIVYNADRTQVLAVLADAMGELVIPEGVTDIADYALSAVYATTKIDCPSSLANIGTGAFPTSASLVSQVWMRADKAPKTADRNVFNTVGPQADLYVHAAYERAYQTASAYRQFKSTRLFGSVVTATGAVREYGDENPTFGYSLKGEQIQGEPAFVTEADIHSPAGTYVIMPTQGSITTPDVVFQEGKLIVQKAPLTARPDDCKRFMGQDNPEFTISYSGLKNDDTPDILIQQPIASTTATAQSAAGTYPITLSGGESDRYELTLQEGTLTVVDGSDPMAIQTVSSAATDARQPLYDLTGRRVNARQSSPATLKKGIYISGGRKTVVGK